VPRPGPPCPERPRGRLARACALLLAWACLDPRRTAAQEGFVEVDGAALVLDGAPFAFVGGNAAVMHGLPHRSALEATLDAIAADGGRVVRVWALGEVEADAPDWADAFGFTRGPGGPITSSFEHLDRVLEGCRARGLRAIVVLANRWSDYGGLPRYLGWAEVPFALDAHGALPELSLPLFFGSARARALLSGHIERVVGRTSALTGLPYRDDPTVLAWELFNEISAPPRARGALVELLEALAAQVHAIDPHHLVSAGHIGFERARDRRTWEAAVGARGIDYADAHAYPAAYDRTRNLAELDAWVLERVRAARRVGRPLIFGEVGFTTSAPRLLGIPRARLLDRFLRAARRFGAAGVLPWIYTGHVDAPREHGLLVDGSVERTFDLRRVIARHARRFSAADPRTVTPPRTRPIARTISGTARPHARWTIEGAVRRLRIAPEAFARLRFEAGGFFVGAPSSHVYGSGTGELRYRFTVPALRRGAGVLRLRARLSSELPGRGEGAGPEDTAELVVRLDGVEVGRARLPVDDGVGSTLELVSEAPEVLARLRRSGARTLVFAVQEPDAPGLCVYGPGEDPRWLDAIELELEEPSG
jgi:mannan endo-1,4-beta-mannosidase